MKRIIFSALTGLIILFFLFSCEDDKGSGNVTGRVVANSGCKNLKSSDLTDDITSSQSCINYSYRKSDKKLEVKHINAGFNCCPGNLTCTVEIAGDTIIIEESEEKAMCNCDCLFDLEMEATGISSGKYVVKFIEPYCGNQEKILFKVDLTRQPEGTYCVTRKLYPWGM